MHIHILLSKWGTVLKQGTLRVILIPVTGPSLSAHAICRSLWTCKSASLPWKAVLLFAWSTAQGISHLESLCSGAMNNQPTPACPFNYSQPAPACPRVDFVRDLPLFGFLTNGSPKQKGKRILHVPG